jgi:YVTN family beta-propeller protein
MKRSQTMKCSLIAILSIVLALVFSMEAKDEASLPNGPDSTGAVKLPNGWRITPAGKHIKVPGDFPLKMFVSPDGAQLFVNTGGFHDHSLSVIDLRKRELTEKLDVVKTWAGMAFDSSSGTIYLSGGGKVVPRLSLEMKSPDISQEIKNSVDKPILRVQYTGGKLVPQHALRIAGLEEKDRYIAGIVIGPDRTLYTLNLQNDTLYRLSGPDFTEQASAKTGYRPYGLALSPDGKTLAVSNWGDRSVSLFDPESLAEVVRIPVGSQPGEIAWSKDGRLFVVNSGSNDVSVIAAHAVVETINTSIDPRAPIGSTPSALAIAPDGSRLYVANSGNNNVTAVDISNRKESHILGFIPTGWYPSALAVAPDGKQLFVGTAKGMTFGKNYPGVTSQQLTNYNPTTPFDYIARMLTGYVSIVDVPDVKGLAAYTKQAVANIPVPAAHIDAAAAAKIQRKVFPKIHHILYIIRENRTYDQVFGDLGIGNGDPNLVFFGEKVTPNAHSLTRKFVTLDSLYCDGEVSEDGHQWSNAAYATDFNQKAWTAHYGNRGEPEADERLNSSPAGYIWDAAARKNLTFRSYGEMASFTSAPDTAPEVKAEGSLKGHVSEEWLKLKHGRDTEKAAVFIRELQEAEETGEWPNLMVMSLGEDHTAGLTPGAFTPFAAVASNDLALGQIVEAVSRSRFWKETAIFVIEDDAQAGPDHVDAHRTVGLVISPWVKRGVVDSTFYSTSSFVRTIELILGLPPMTQFDKAATPMYASFTSVPTFEPIPALPPTVDLQARNPKEGPLANASLKLDFSEYDRADPDELNRILWNALRPGQPMPAPIRSARLH